MTRPKKKIHWQQYVSVVVFVLIGIVCGALMARHLDSLISSGSTVQEDVLTMIMLFLGMYISFLVQLIVHELGHLVFGLLTGYRFSSFRIGSFMWVKEEGKLRLRRLSIAGTGGQCLMIPPDIVDGKLPVVLYNLGGAIMNVAVGILFLGLSFLPSKLIAVFFLMAAVIGIAFAVINGVPLRLGVVDNDGYNAFSLKRHPDALRGFWVQMKANELTAKGVRIKDMPADWFEVPDDTQMKNSMIAPLGVFACNRLMDEHRFEEADALIQRLLSLDSGIVGLHRGMLLCDRIYCELLGQNRPQVLEECLTKEQHKFMRSMKHFPSVIRTRYVYTLLAQHDQEAAARLEAAFEKSVETYPYSSDVASERELMALAQSKAMS